MKMPIYLSTDLERRGWIFYFSDYGVNFMVLYMLFSNDVWHYALILHMSRTWSTMPWWCFLQVLETSPCRRGAARILNWHYFVPFLQERVLHHPRLVHSAAHRCRAVLQSICADTWITASPAVEPLDENMQKTQKTMSILWLNRPHKFIISYPC